MQPDIVATLMGNVMKLFLMIKSFKASKFKKEKNWSNFEFVHPFANLVTIIDSLFMTESLLFPYPD